MAAGLAALVLGACSSPEDMDPDQKMEEATQLIAARRYREGLEIMQGLVEASPGDARLQLHYGQALIASGQMSLAVWPLSRATRDPEYLVPAGLLLARAQFRAGSGIDAVNTATRVLEAEPDNEMALFIRVEALLSENLEERALEDLDRLEAISDDTASVVLLRLDALLGLRREDEAEALLSEMAEKAEAMRAEDPVNAARLCAATSTFTAERGDIDGARERFAACLESEGVEHMVLARAAIDFYDRIGEAKLATDIFLRRFEEHTDRLALRVEYANRLQQIGRADEAEKLLLEVTESEPAAWAALADIYAVAGRLRDAVNAFDHVIENAPGDKEDWLFTRADFLLALGEIEAARETLALLEVDAHRALLTARIALAEEDFETAARQFEEGLRLWPDNASARYLAGRTYERLGKWSQAAAHYREAARMQEPHFEASIALADLQSALGDFEGVQFLLSRLAEGDPANPEIAERMLRFAWDSGSKDLATRTLTQLNRIPRTAPRVTAMLAERLAEKEGAEAALKFLDQSPLDPGRPAHFELLEARVELLIALERAQEALAEVDEALGRTPDSVALKVLRATALRSMGDLDAASHELRAAAAADPGFLPAPLELARLEAAAGRPEQARRHYEEAERLEQSSATMEDPGESVAALALARLDLDAGRVDAARSRLRALLRRDPRQGEAAWMLVQSYSDPQELGEEERTDLTLRAAVFARNEEAQDLLRRAAEERS
jgi:tetratricopeptide (TPR) repeat protein